MKIVRRDGVSYLIIKGKLVGLMEWPVFVLFFPRLVIHVYLQWWILWSTGKGHAICYWGMFVYGKYWRFLCFRITKAEPAPPMEIWAPDGKNPQFLLHNNEFIRIDEPSKP